MIIKETTRKIKNVLKTYEMFDEEIILHYVEIEREDKDGDPVVDRFYYVSVFKNDRPTIRVFHTDYEKISQLFDFLTDRYTSLMVY